MNTIFTKGEKNKELNYPAMSYFQHFQKSLNQLPVNKWKNYLQMIKMLSESQNGFRKCPAVSSPSKEIYWPLSETAASLCYDQSKVFD